MQQPVGHHCVAGEGAVAHRVAAAEDGGGQVVVAGVVVDAAPGSVAAGRVPLAGGLGQRYAAGGDSTPAPAVHSYASDDYLTNTVLGGRNPMCDGPFSRSAVMTYWLLHDLCAELAGANCCRTNSARASTSIA